jgi:steroid 5-alpha reductase family enzyme
VAVALWLIGFFFEAIGDQQLASFKADPANRGKVLDRGALALHATPQLLRRGMHLVGLLPIRGRRRRLVDHFVTRC